MIEKVKAFIEKYHMIKPGEHILVGLSGGADSVCLFFLLHCLACEMDFQVSAIHVNHMLRGENAHRDERFSEEFAQKLGRTCHCFSVPVDKIAQKEKLSLEEAGRKVRYRLFLDTAKKIGAASVALAHHKNDQSETMLFHLARGCGISGLRGIRPVRTWKDEQVMIIRPLLCMTRKEIQDYLEENHISYITDETNDSNTFSRNKIRNQLIPFMEQELCRQTVEHMAHTAELLGEAEDFLNEVIDRAFQKAVSRQEDKAVGTKYIVSMNVLMREHSYVKGAVLKKTLEQLADANKDLEKTHVEKLLELCRLTVGKKISLPYGICATKGYQVIFLEKEAEGCRSREENQKKNFVPVVSFYPPSSGEEIEVDLRNGTILKVKVMSYEEFRMNVCEGKDGEVPKKTYTKWFDCDKIEKCLQIRTRQTGDYFYINENHKKKLKDYFINEKVLREKRDFVPLIACESHILWILGGRISDYYKVNESTNKIMELTIRGGLTDGREA